MEIDLFLCRNFTIMNLFVTFCTAFICTFCTHWNVDAAIHFPYKSWLEGRWIRILSNMIVANIWMTTYTSRVVFPKRKRDASTLAMERYRTCGRIPTQALLLENFMMGRSRSNGSHFSQGSLRVWTWIERRLGCTQGVRLNF